MLLMVFRSKSLHCDRVYGVLGIPRRSAAADPTTISKLGLSRGGSYGFATDMGMRGPIKRSDERCT